MAERWMCVFEGRAGSRAQAVFLSKEQAREFAERHAHAMTSKVVPINWQDRDDETVFDTLLGTYRIVRVDDA